jgi:hypothetical protein
VMARIQADFVRNFCRPALAASLLAADGDRLNADTQARIHAAAGMAPLPQPLSRKRERGER